MPKRAAADAISRPERTPTPRALIKAVSRFKEIARLEAKADRAAQTVRTRHSDSCLISAVRLTNSDRNRPDRRTLGL